MTTQTRRLTYEEYLEGPEIKQRYEIIDGEMRMAPTPTVQHQRILRQLFILLNAFVSERQLGEVFFAPLDVVIQREPLRTRQPDLLFVRQAQVSLLGQIVEIAPDLMIEVLSPSNSRRDVEEKLADYAGISVRECWFVSPEARTVEVLELDEGSWKRIYLVGLGDILKSNVLEGFEVEVRKIFE